MAKSNQSKSKLHPRNKHRGSYDFNALCESFPRLGHFVKPTKFGHDSIDFSDPRAVITLNKALLIHFYKIENWSIPHGYLCPPIPGRADYIHSIADLLAIDNKGVVPTGKNVRILDIGTGSSCIYPIIGTAEYGWSFIGTDIDPASIENAAYIIDNNPSLKELVTLKTQSNRRYLFKGLFFPKGKFDVVMCNPPFHKSKKEAQQATLRKEKNLGTNKGPEVTRNFGGEGNELWCEGGEALFIRKMIQESAAMPKFSTWFTSLVAKKETLNYLNKHLKKTDVAEVRIIEMSQGQKTSRLIAWRF